MGDSVVGTADKESHAQQEMVILEQDCAQTTEEVHQVSHQDGRLPSEAKVKWELVLLCLGEAAAYKSFVSPQRKQPAVLPSQNTVCINMGLVSSPQTQAL